MPFGKWRGLPLTEIPESYLSWVLEVAREPLRTAILRELARRGASEPPVPGLDLRIDPVAALDLIDAGRRALARKHHPDVAGGDAARMATINDTADRLAALFAAGAARDGWAA